MDDLIITKSNSKEIEAFKSSMKTKFDMTDFGFLNSYLGIEVIQGKFEIKICQTTYALKVLDEFNMRELYSSKSPMELCLKVNLEGEGVEVEPTLFIKLIGCLTYLTLTHLDLVFLVSYLSQFMRKPCSHHMATAKRILRYVNGNL